MTGRGEEVVTVAGTRMEVRSRQNGLEAGSGIRRGARGK